MKINERFSPELLNVVTHFYRGEVQRATDWRKRLDTTTNWAIIAMTATFSWAFRSVEAGVESHIVFLFTSLTVFLLLWVEARRYRHFDVWRTRVRMLEVHVLVPALNPELDIVQGDWREVLSNDLLQPSYKISRWEATSARLQANYIWIFVALLGGWLLRIYTGAPRVDGRPLTLSEFYEACGYGILAPLQVVGGFSTFWLLLLVILAGTWKHRGATGEIRRRDRNAKQWPI